LHGFCNRSVRAVTRSLPSLLLRLIFPEDHVSRLAADTAMRRCKNEADRVETLFTGALASIGLEILSEFFEPGIFGL
jgi:hypothetical protein